MNLYADEPGWVRLWQRGSDLWLNRSALMAPEDIPEFRTVLAYWEITRNSYSLEMHAGYHGGHVIREHFTVHRRRPRPDLLCLMTPQWPGVAR